MNIPNSPLYYRLLDKIQTVPVIDCHEHLMGPEMRPKYKEPIAALTHGYILSDLQSAAYGIDEKEIQRLNDPEVPTIQKWPLFKKLWQSTEHTAYAQVTKRVLKQLYGQKEISFDILELIAEKFLTYDEAAYFKLIDQANIQAMVVDTLGWLPNGLGSFLSGEKTFPSKWRLMISLPNFHNPKFGWTTIQYFAGLIDQHVTSLDEFLEVVYKIFLRCIERGVIGFKDQSAYERIISYDLVSKGEAEKLFNQILADPRGELGWPESKPLNDFLFHQFMRFARELNLPVQLHTGHMAGNYNRVDKTNAANMASVFELHKQVRFDLFHGNWPYMGDLLFLGKNYPNVFLNLCWVHIIDPAYSIELLERATLTIPHVKIHGFGGDYGDVPEYVVAHLQIAQENIASALTNLIESRWIEEEQAISLAKDWLFNNPNRFFKLGFPEI
jgi:hypothetical protein